MKARSGSVLNRMDLRFWLFYVSVFWVRNLIIQPVLLPAEPPQQSGGPGQSFGTGSSASASSHHNAGGTGRNTGLQRIEEAEQYLIRS